MKTEKRSGNDEANQASIFCYDDLKSRKVENEKREKNTLKKGLSALRDEVVP